MFLHIKRPRRKKDTERKKKKEKRHLSQYTKEANLGKKGCECEC
jgi:hypothetical protein